jgi:hypothetical protein
VRNFVWLPDPIDAMQQLLLFVERKQGSRHRLVGIETLGNSLGPIIGPML